MTKMLSFWKKTNKAFCRVFLCKVNLLRDAIIIFVAVVISAAIIFVSNYSLRIDILEKPVVQESDSYLLGANLLSEEDIYQEVKSIQDTIDNKNWKKYQSKWYGFEIGYPDTWINPKGIAPKSDSKWEYRYQFRKTADNKTTSSFYTGFDVAVYNLSKVNGLKETEEFPALKDGGQAKTNQQCETIDGHIIETGDYPAEEIYISPKDDCYERTIFFSYTKGDYIYDLVPVLQDGFLLSGDPRIEISNSFPEFYAVASTLNPIDIVRPKPAPLKPKITAPFPVSYKVENGKLVCAKKNDKPSKSDKNKGKHLDMECCLDPDEYPNPHCYYDPAKYGKYL